MYIRIIILKANHLSNIWQIRNYIYIIYNIRVYIYFQNKNMKNRNITQLNFSNDELRTLCSHYGRILSIITKIDEVAHSKEVDFVLSLITRTNLEWDNNILNKISHSKEERKIDIKWYTINNDYIRVFELENIIFYELEKNLQAFIKEIETKESFDLMIQKTNESIDKIKEILFSKKDLTWEKYIHWLFNGLYLYCEKIALLVGGKQMFGQKIVPQEQKILDLLKEKLEISWIINQEHIDYNRWVWQNTKILFN